jgi:hypothetical protein
MIALRILSRKFDRNSVKLARHFSSVSKPACGPPNITKPKIGAQDEDEDDLEEMFVQGPNGIEWGGPTRGGSKPEPTRYGDWERKGRVSDFK